MTEDYYVNASLDIFSWVNPERRIYKIASSYGVPIVNAPFCTHPLVPLRGIVHKQSAIEVPTLHDDIGKYNETHWRVHVSYSEQILITCLGKTYLDLIAKRKRLVVSIPPSKSQNHGKYRYIGPDKQHRDEDVKRFYSFSYLQSMILHHRCLLQQNQSQIHPNLHDALHSDFVAKCVRREANFSACCSNNLIEAMKAQVVDIQFVNKYL